MGYDGDMRGLRGAATAAAGLALALVVACGRQLGGGDGDDGSALPEGTDASTTGAAPDDAGLGRDGAPHELDGSAPLTCPPRDANGPRIAFVTYVRFPGDHPGDGAPGPAKFDALCTKLATDAKIAGKFVAYVKDGADEPERRIRNSGVGWMRPDHQPLFVGATIPLDVPATPLEVTEKCTLVVDDAGAWTGLSPTGTNEQSCTDWTNAAPQAQGHYGAPSATTASWRTEAAGSCATPRHFYCFETAD